MPQNYRGIEINVPGDANWGTRGYHVDKKMLDDVSTIKSVDTIGCMRREKVIIPATENKILWPYVGNSSGIVRGVAKVYNPPLMQTKFNNPDAMDGWVLGNGVTYELTNHMGESCVKFIVPAGFTGTIVEKMWGYREFDNDNPYRLSHKFNTISTDAHNVSFELYSHTQNSSRFTNGSSQSTDPAWFYYEGNFSIYKDWGDPESNGEIMSYRVTMDSPCTAPVYVYLEDVTIATNNDGTESNGSRFYFSVEYFMGGKVNGTDIVKGSSGYFSSNPPTINYNSLSAPNKAIEVDLVYQVFD